MKIIANMKNPLHVRFTKRERERKGKVALKISMANCYTQVFIFQDPNSNAAPAKMNQKNPTKTYYQ